MNTTDTIRVMKVVPTLLCGGTEHQFTALAQRLDEGRFRVTCACLRRRGDLAGELERSGIELQEYPITSFTSIGCLTQQGRFAFAARRQNIDVVHAYSFYGNVFAVPPARAAGVPVVIASVRDCGPYLSPWQTRAQRAICRLADRVLVNADAVKTWLVEDGYDADTIAVIRNGVDLSRFQQGQDVAAVRAGLGLPPDNPVVGVVSRLVPLKGLEAFLDAAALLSPSFPGVRFAVVGESPPEGRAYEQTLKQRARTLGIDGRTVFAGRRSDVPSILAALTVSVVPSLSEGLPNVLLESMAARTPVVATRVGGIPEVLVGGTGLVVEAGSANALAESIGRLLAQPSLARALAAAGRDRVEAEFSLERMARETENLYVEAVAAKRRRQASASGAPITPRA